MKRCGPLRHVAHFAALPKRGSFYQIQLCYASSQTGPPPRSLDHLQKPAKPAQSDNAFAKGRAIPWVLSSLMAGALAFYSANLYVAATQPCSNPRIMELAEQKDVSGRYDDTADSFDSDVGLTEVLMGVNSLRKRLAAQCQGHVLEVSCGTGRNLGYYDIMKGGRVDSLTFVDLSPQMIEVCKKKWDVLFGRKKDRLKETLIVRFLPGSALGQMPLAPTSPAPKGYDAIIQTMGLCSTPTPVELLANIVRYLDTSNPDARIFLLEHGRSYQHWLNNILDGSAEKHAEIHGCWYNREIGALVEDAAAKTGLEIVRERRFHLGTTWVFELRPKPGYVATPSPQSDAVEQSSRSWFSWPK